MNYEKFSTSPRHEIPDEFKWDLSLAYKSRADWDADFAKIAPLMAELDELRGKLGKSPANIAKALDLEDRIERIVENLSSYARQKSDEDSADNANLSLCGKISAKSTEIDARTSWIDPELLDMPEKRLLAFAEKPELSFYKKTILDLIKEKEHTLGAAEERLLGLASDAMSSSYETFSLLSNADLRFPSVKDENGVETELTQSNFMLFLRKKDRNIRKEAFEKFYSRYSEFKNSFAAILDGTVKANIFETRARNFGSCLGAALFEDRIPENLYTGLIKSVRGKFPLIHEYFHLRKKKLGLDEMHLYDVHHSLVDESDRRWSWEEARDTVLASIEPMGPEYVACARKAFSGRWMDVLPNKGKRSGAYSGGSYDSPQYILLNFNGRLDDVFTLAHELGHSMHSLFSNRTQKYHYADYSIFLAEIASISSELLLHEHLLRNSQDEKFRRTITDHILDEFRGTVVRQTMFAEFELLTHRRREEDESLTADFLCSEYYRLVSEYFGKDVVCDRLIEVEWARIPHFHYGFYVYKYATGFAAAAKFAKRISAGDKDAIPDYMRFISAGSSKDVLDILRDSGVDPLDPGFIGDAFGLFEEKTSEFFGRQVRR